MLEVTTDRNQFTRPKVIANRVDVVTNEHSRPTALVVVRIAIEVAASTAFSTAIWAECLRTALILAVLLHCKTKPTMSGAKLAPGCVALCEVTPPKVRI